jgi:hypothetical protein
LPLSIDLVDRVNRHVHGLDVIFEDWDVIVVDVILIIWHVEVGDFFLGVWVVNRGSKIVGFICVFHDIISSIVRFFVILVIVNSWESTEWLSVILNNFPFYSILH